MSEQTITSTEQRDGIIVTTVLQAEMDEAATAKMQEEAVAAAEQAPGLPLVLDLSKVTFFPSLALGAAVTLLNSLKKRGQGLVLVGMHPDVRSSFAVTRLDKLFEIHDDVDTYLAHRRRREAPPEA
jgi:anti-sigma B factor antagonist